MSDEPRRWKGVTLGLNPPEGFGVDVREDRITDSDIEKVAKHRYALSEHVAYMTWDAPDNPHCERYRASAHVLLALVLGDES